MFTVGAICFCLGFFVALLCAVVCHNKGRTGQNKTDTSTESTVHSIAERTVEAGRRNYREAEQIVESAIKTDNEVQNIINNIVERPIRRERGVDNEGNIE